jgi:uncharacterized cupredoxin-like copper-binding protein
MMRKLLTVSILLIGMVILSACASPTTPAPPPSEGQTVEVELVSYEIHMSQTLQAGTLTFHVVNNTDDGEEHSLEIEGNGIEVELESHLQPGEEGTLTVDLAPGTYRFYCPVEDHAEEHGMEIEVTVE